MTNRNRLPFIPLLYYSIGNVPLTVMYGFWGAFLLKYYADYVKLDPALIGWAFLIRSAVDVFVDPAIGYWSDRAQFVHGRRRPFFLLGTIPAGILFCLTMMPPSGSQIVIFVYLTVISTLMVCFLSLMGISHLAMGFELTNDYGERTRIFGYKNLIENVSTLTATFSVPLAFQLDEMTFGGHLFSRADCYFVAASTLAALSIGSASIAYWGTTERPIAREACDYRFLDGIIGIFQNKAFRILAIAFCLISIADRMIVAEFFIVIEQFHGIHEEDSIRLLIGYFLGGLCSVWPWVWLANSFGKDVVLRIAIALWPLACGVLVACKWSEMGLCAATFTVGVLGTGMITIFGAIVPDILEYERIRTGQQREGIYVSMGNVVSQIAFGIGFVIAGQTLHAIGYHGDQASSPELINRLRLSFVAIPLLISLLALIVLARFPLTRRTYQELTTQGAPPMTT